MRGGFDFGGVGDAGAGLGGAVKGFGPLAIALCLLTSSACKDDPAQSVKIVDRPSQPPSAVVTTPTAPAHVAVEKPVLNQAVEAAMRASGQIAAQRPSTERRVVTSTPAPDANWIGRFCPPPANDSQGPSSFEATGPCGFRHPEAVKCESLGDDFITAFTLKARNGAALVAYLNVEAYHGPGTYDGAQLFVAVQSATTIDRWSSESVHAVVGPGEAFVTLPETRLDEEPMLVDCTRLIGPSTNYQYQCGTRSYSRPAGDSAAEIVSGKLQCANRR
jgi:hypothetical protein